jgi:hypothetical protein
VTPINTSPSCTLPAQSSAGGGSVHCETGSKTGLPFTTLEFNSKTCSLPEFDEVKGNLVAECGLLNGSGVFVGNDCAEHMTFHLLQQAAAALFPTDVLKFGKKAATLAGIAKIELAGNHAGKSWAGTV